MLQDKSLPTRDRKRWLAVANYVLEWLPHEVHIYGAKMVI